MNKELHSMLVKLHSLGTVTEIDKENAWLLICEAWNTSRKHAIKLCAREAADLVHSWREES